MEGNNTKLKKNKQSFLSMDNLDIAESSGSDKEQERSFAIQDDDPKEFSGSDKLPDIESEIKRKESM